MKIEMGESLFYSWLRHVKECQVVQTNWKTSKQWSLQHEAELAKVMAETKQYFKEKYNYEIYKKTASLSQLLQQAECDALGIAIRDGKTQIYAVDVAFHEGGLLYGSKQETVMRVLVKCLRTAMCIYGYLDSKDAEIYFASPKIYNSTLELLVPCFEDMQNLMNTLGFSFRFGVFANTDFQEQVLNPILQLSHDVVDTSELFLRSYRLLQMFPSSESR